MASAQLLKDLEDATDPEAMEMKALAEKNREFMGSDRFRGKQRPYTPMQVALYQGTQSDMKEYHAAAMATKMYEKLRNHQANKTCSFTFGSLDPVQVTQMAEAGIDTVYVSGWQCSSTASTSNEPGPDLADYPMDTVPNKVDHLFKAQCFHDRKQREFRMRQSSEWRSANPPVDYMNPIIADGDTGHGGLTAIMKLTKMFIENGAAGIHLEDQKPGVKKCGHMGGKVLVSTEEHLQRLIATRLQADIMSVPLIIVARTDAEAATLLDNNIDGRDHAFILGATVEGVESQREAMANGTGSDWNTRAGVMTYPELINKILGEVNAAAIPQWEAECYGKSLTEMRQLAMTLGAGNPFFDWELPRAVEGYYRVKGGVKFCATRAKAWAPFADLIWMETGKPIYNDAKKFSEEVLAAYPDQMLSYNQSPSFNWDASGLTDLEMGEYVTKLGALGFQWQFITLAGFHLNALACATFSRALQKERMIAYVRDIQRGERQEKVSTLTHQKWSGSELIDALIGTITSGKASTAIMSAGVTEAQFEKAVPHANGHANGKKTLD